MAVARCTHTHGRFARVKTTGVLAFELLNLNSHYSLVHERNSISNKSLPRESFFGMEIGGALSCSLRRKSGARSILGYEYYLNLFLRAILSVINFIFA